MAKRVILLLLVVTLFIASRAVAGPLPGAIFTTLPDGSRVNANIYDQKEDVYLDGGPGPNAPIGAAGLPEGWYYFQVTDPSGKVLLSQDPVKCRSFHVNSQGIIDQVGAASCLKKIKGQLTETACTHLTGTDVDHGALTVQLMPYADTPNNGGVYKVWATPVEYFVGNPNLVDNPEYFHGFRPSWSKTDNYKVRKGKPFTPPVIHVLKVNDLNVNGIWDNGEPQITGWPVSVLDPLDVLNSGFTPWDIMAVPSGLWVVSEDTVLGWLPTRSILDSAYQPSPWSPVNVNVAGTTGEAHTVVFLNAELGQIKACKKYASAEGVPVSGFKICAEGTAVNGSTFGPVCQYTDATGCTTFGDLVNNLIAGNYIVCESLPLGGWFNTTTLCSNLTLPAGGTTTVTFVNYCTKKVGMHTKGFWQNQGCDIVNSADLAYLNSLAPYASGSIATGGTDNCSGTPCPDVTALPLDTVNELGCYIVASNSQPTYPNIGLAQQLAAFILNMRHGESLYATIIDGSQYSVQDVISAAILAWQTGNNVSYWQPKLDAWNNAGTLDVIMDVPCEVAY